MADQRGRLSWPMAPPAPLVGREREQAALGETLDAALASHGALVLIGGEAGIGKTTLAEWLLAAAAAQGALVLVGRCYDLSETPPYGPWQEALARAPGGDAVPPLPDLVGGGGTASQAALFAQIRDTLTALAARQPLVLLLDDLHWADLASLDLLRFLGRLVAAVPLLLLATYRADELTRRHPLYQLLPLLVREARAQRLDLQRLEAGDLRALLRERYGLAPADEDRLVAYLQERSEGNPFFAGELLRALEEGQKLRQGDQSWALDDLAAMDVPPLLRQVLDARLDRLGEETRELLAVAAVIGQAVPVALWQAVAWADEDTLLDTLGRATAAHLLAERPDGQGARFAHALVREALYAGTLPRRRRALHRRIAEALLARPAPDPDAVADHFRRAGDNRAVAWLVRAGERAQLAYAWLTAVERYEAALALLEDAGDDPAQQGWLRYRVARLRRWSTPRQGVAYLDEALRLAEAAGDRALAAAARYSRGLCLSYEAEYGAAISDMAVGADALEALPPGELARLDLGPDAHGVPTATNPRGYLVCILALRAPNKPRHSQRELVQMRAPPRSRNA